MTEYRFVYERDLRPGRTVFEVVNIGKERHRFGVWRLPDDMPPIDVQLNSDVRRPINHPVADLPYQEPGERNVVAVDLLPGVRYAFLCLLPAADEVSHSVKGMTADFRIPKPSG